MKTTAHPDARLALTTKGETTTVDLYSPEGLAMVSDLWLKLSAEFKVMYEPTWMGVRHHSSVIAVTRCFTHKANCVTSTGFICICIGNYCAPIDGHQVSNVLAAHHAHANYAVPQRLA